MKRIAFYGIAVLAICCSACTLTQNPSSTIAEEDSDYEPSRQILQFQDMRDGYYLQFAKKQGDAMEWCQDTVVEQKQLIVGNNPVGRVCLEADHRYYLD